MYVRGEAYLRLHNGAKAATEYQKILDHQGIATSPLYSLARLGWDEPMFFKMIPSRQSPPIKTSWQTGKMPTLMSLS